MLQRVRDLKVQYSNGTLSADDKKAIVAEVDPARQGDHGHRRQDRVQRHLAAERRRSRGHHLPGRRQPGREHHRLGRCHSRVPRRVGCGFGLRRRLRGAGGTDDVRGVASRRPRRRRPPPREVKAKGVYDVLDARQQPDGRRRHARRRRESTAPAVRSRRRPSRPWTSTSSTRRSTTCRTTRSESRRGAEPPRAPPQQPRDLPGEPGGVREPDPRRGHGRRDGQLHEAQHPAAGRHEHARAGQPGPAGRPRRSCASPEIGTPAARVALVAGAGSPRRPTPSPAWSRRRPHTSTEGRIAARAGARLAAARVGAAAARLRSGPSL